jgi:hypothetical protein
MKIGVISFGLLFVVFTSAFGENKEIQIIETHYGVSIMQIRTGSGHGIGYTLNGSICKGRKTLEVGMILSESEWRITGCDFKYQLMIGNLNRIQSENKIYKPYIQINLIYRKALSYSSDLVKLGAETYDIPSKPGMISTIGHYMAYGNKIRLVDRVSLDTSLGFGFYMGSIDKVNGPGTFGIHYENSGFTFSFKAGLAYSFR